MKILIALFLCAASVRAAGATLEWDANPPVEFYTNDIAGVVGGIVTSNVLASYRVYVGSVTRSYSASYTTTNTTFTVTNLVNGTNYFAVTAFDTDGMESEFSEEVYLVWTNRPAKVRSLRFAPVLTAQSAPTVNGPWSSEVQLAQLDVTDRARFYRLAIAMPELAVTLATKTAPTKVFISAPAPKSGKLTTSPKRRVMVPPPMP